jgi:L-amino acid N-acyltransferase YncA
MTTCRVRDAAKADAGAINAILNHYVLTSTATFILEPVTLEERQKWLAGHGAPHPVILAEIDGMTVGFGSLSAFRPRAAYAHSVELSVYVHPRFHRQGIGRLIVESLLSRARALGHHVVVAGCCGESQASIALLKSFGFTPAGHFREVGRKFDRWLDVVFLERRLE